MSSKYARSWHGAVLCGGRSLTPPNSTRTLNPHPHRQPSALAPSLAVSPGPSPEPRPSHHPRRPPLTRCELVVEAVFESLAVKQQATTRYALLSNHYSLRTTYHLPRTTYHLLQIFAQLEATIHYGLTIYGSTYYGRSLRSSRPSARPARCSAPTPRPSTSMPSPPSPPAAPTWSSACTSHHCATHHAMHRGMHHAIHHGMHHAMHRVTVSRTVPGHGHALLLPRQRHAPR